MRGPVRHDSIENLAACRLGLGSSIEETRLGAIYARKDVAQRFGSDPANGGHEYVSAGYDGIECALGGLCLDTVDDRLDLFIGCLALQECPKLQALFRKGGVYEVLTTNRDLVS